MMLSTLMWMKTCSRGHQVSRMAIQSRTASTSVWAAKWMSLTAAPMLRMHANRKIHTQATSTACARYQCPKGKMINELCQAEHGACRCCCAPINMSFCFFVLSVFVLKLFCCCWFIYFFHIYKFKFFFLVFKDYLNSCFIFFIYHIKCWNKTSFLI